MTYLFAEVVDGRDASTTHHLRRALGREPGSFGNYARRTAATGVWNAVAALGVSHRSWA